MGGADVGHGHVGRHLGAQETVDLVEGVPQVAAVDALEVGAPHGQLGLVADLDGEQRGVGGQGAALAGHLAVGIEPLAAGHVVADGLVVGPQRGGEGEAVCGEGVAPLARQARERAAVGALEVEPQLAEQLDGLRQVVVREGAAHGALGEDRLAVDRVGVVGRRPSPGVAQGRGGVALDDADVAERHLALHLVHGLAAAQEHDPQGVEDGAIEEPAERTIDGELEPRVLGSQRGRGACHQSAAWGDDAGRERLGGPAAHRRHHDGHAAAVGREVEPCAHHWVHQLARGLGGRRGERGAQLGGGRGRHGAAGLARGGAHGRELCPQEEAAAVGPCVELALERQHRLKLVEALLAEGGQLADGGHLRAHGRIVGRHAALQLGAGAGQVGDERAAAGRVAELPHEAGEWAGVGREAFEVGPALLECGQALGPHPPLDQKLTCHVEQAAPLQLRPGRRGRHAALAQRHGVHPRPAAPRFAVGTERHLHRPGVLRAVVGLEHEGEAGPGLSPPHRARAGEAEPAALAEPRGHQARALAAGQLGAHPGRQQVRPIGGERQPRGVQGRVLHADARQLDAAAPVARLRARHAHRARTVAPVAREEALPRHGLLRGRIDLLEAAVGQQLGADGLRPAGPPGLREGEQSSQRTRRAPTPQRHHGVSSHPASKGSSLPRPAQAQVGGHEALAKGWPTCYPFCSGLDKVWRAANESGGGPFAWHPVPKETTPCARRTDGHPWHRASR